MPHSKKEILKVTERRAKVAELLHKGLRQIEIADALGLGRGAAGQMTVSRDLKAVRDAWKMSGVRDFEADRARLLEEIALGKREAWAAWDASKEDADGNPAKPDIKFFNAILECWSREAELLGLSLPDLIVQQTMNNQQVLGERPTVRMTPTERAEAVRAILVAASRTDGANSEAAQLLQIMGPADGQPLPAGLVHEHVAPPSTPTNDGETSCHGEQDDGQVSRLPYGLREWEPDDDPDGSDHDIKPLFGG